MAAVGLGYPHTVSLPVADSAGVPVTSGVAGTIALYGPASATPIALGANTLAHLGEGLWGVTIPAAALTVAGCYRWVAASVTYGATGLLDVGGLFTVGRVDPRHRSLLAVLLAVYEGLGDLIRGSGTGGAGTLTDARRAGAGLDANEWLGSELLILGTNPPATNPLRVDGFNPATGQFTVAPATTLAGTLDYLLVNHEGGGYPYARVLDAVLGAVARVPLVEQVADAVSLTGLASGREYPLPAAWRAVTGVQANVSGVAGDWEEIAPGYWTWDAGRRVLRDAAGVFPPGKALRLAGTIDVPPPRLHGDLVRLPWDWVRDAATGELLAGSAGAGDQRRAAVLLDRAARMQPRLARG